MGFNSAFKGLMFTAVPPDRIGYLFTVHIHIATSYDSKVEVPDSFLAF